MAPSPEYPENACLREVEICDIFIGIYAHRYGYVPPGSNISITEMEFDYARALGKPIFCFLLDENYPWPPKMIEDDPGKSNLEDFKAKISQAVVWEKFRTPEDLQLKIATSISRYFLKFSVPKSIPNPYRNLLGDCNDLANLLGKALKELEKITGTDYNQIFLVSTSAHSLKLVSVAASIPFYKQCYRFAIFEGLIGSSFKEGKIINASNVRERPNYFQAVIETQSELVVPIKWQGVVYGVLNSESEEVEHYNDEIQFRMEQLASAIGESLLLSGWNPGVPPSSLPWIIL